MVTAGAAHATRQGGGGGDDADQEYMAVEVGGSGGLPRLPQDVACMNLEEMTKLLSSGCVVQHDADGNVMTAEEMLDLLAYADSAGMYDNEDAGGGDEYMATGPDPEQDEYMSTEPLHTAAGAGAEEDDEYLDTAGLEPAGRRATTRAAGRATNANAFGGALLHPTPAGARAVMRAQLVRQLQILRSPKGAPESKSRANSFGEHAVMEHQTLPTSSLSPCASDGADEPQAAGVVLHHARQGRQLGGEVAGEEADTEVEGELPSQFFGSRFAEQQQQQQSNLTLPSGFFGMRTNAVDDFAVVKGTGTGAGTALANPNAQAAGKAGPSEEVFTAQTASNSGMDKLFGVAPSRAVVEAGVFVASKQTNDADRRGPEGSPVAPRRGKKKVVDLDGLRKSLFVRGHHLEGADGGASICEGGLPAPMLAEISKGAQQGDNR